MRLPPGCSESRATIEALLKGRSPEATAQAVGIALPASLDAAVPVRRAEFLAGRWCAREALRMAGQWPPVAPPIGPDRAPAWPKGYVGSITHSRGEAWAVAAPVASLRGVGIDLERELDEAGALELAPAVLARGEQLPALVQEDNSPWPMPRRLALLFSLKEAFYKCVAPLGGDALGFADVRIADCDATSGAAQMELLRTASPDLRAGLLVPAAFAVEAGRVLCCVWWPTQGGITGA